MAFPGTCNIPVSGVIVGEFEHGYFVTMRMGEESLRGVLYKATQSSEAISSAIGNASTSGVPDASPTQPGRSKAEDNAGGNQSVEEGMEK